MTLGIEEPPGGYADQPPGGYADEPPGGYANDYGPGPTNVAARELSKRKNIRKPFYVAQDSKLTASEKDKAIAEYYGADYEQMKKSPQYKPGILAAKVVAPDDFQYSLGQTGGGVIPLGLAQGATGLVSNANRLLTKAGKAVGAVHPGTEQLNNVLHNLNEYNYRESTSNPETGEGYSGQDFYHTLGTIPSAMLGDKAVKGTGAVANALRGASAGASAPTVVNYRGDGSDDLTSQLLKNTSLGALTNTIAAPVMGAVSRVANQGVKETSKEIAQRLFNVTEKQRVTAARRIAAAKKLNAKYGSNLELSAGQASGNPGMISAETASEYAPGGMTKVRVQGNEEMLNLANSRLKAIQQELQNTPYRNLGDLAEAVANNDKDAARILRDFVEVTGEDPAKIMAASREVNLFPLKQRNDAIWDTFRKEGDSVGPISMEGEVERLNPFIDKLDDVMGTEVDGIKSAIRTARDIRDAQAELFPTPMIELQGGRPNITPGPSSGLFNEPSKWNFAGNTRPASTSKVLDPGNVQKSIAQLKKAAANARNSGDNQLAGVLDQVVTGMDTKLELAASRNPSLRASYDAARQDTKLNLLPVQEAETAVTYKGPDGGTGVQIPQAIALEDRGLAAARFQAEKEANKSAFSFGKKQRGVFDVDKAATVLENPALDQFYSGAGAEERQALIDLFRATTENPKVVANPVNGARMAGLDGIKMTLGMGAGAVTTPLALGPAARKLFTSRLGKELLLENPELIADNPILQQAFAKYMPMYFSGSPSNGEVE